MFNSSKDDSNGEFHAPRKRPRCWPIFYVPLEARAVMAMIIQLVPYPILFYARISPFYLAPVHFVTDSIDAQLLAYVSSVKLVKWPYMRFFYPSATAWEYYWQDKPCDMVLTGMLFTYVYWYLDTEMPPNAEVWRTVFLVAITFRFIGECYSWCMRRFELVLWNPVTNTLYLWSLIYLVLWGGHFEASYAPWLIFAGANVIGFFQTGSTMWLSGNTSRKSIETRIVDLYKRENIENYFEERLPLKKRKAPRRVLVSASGN